MIPIPKGGKVYSSNADQYISIAISNIQVKYQDDVIIEQQADYLVTYDSQFCFKCHSSTMVCTTMLIETIRYHNENEKQTV